MLHPQLESIGMLLLTRYMRFHKLKLNSIIGLQDLIKYIMLSSCFFGFEPQLSISIRYYDLLLYIEHLPALPLVSLPAVVLLFFNLNTQYRAHNLA